MCNMTPYERNGFNVQYDRYAEIKHVLVHVFDRQERNNVGVKFYVEDGVAYFTKIVDDVANGTRESAIRKAADAVTDVHGVEENSQDVTDHVAKTV